MKTENLLKKVYILDNKIILRIKQKLVLMLTFQVMINDHDKDFVKQIQIDQFFRIKCLKNKNKLNLEVLNIN